MPTWRGTSYASPPGMRIHRHLVSFAVACSCVLGGAALAQPYPPPPDAYGGAPAYRDDNDPRALIEFRTALDPYGAWVNDATYGTVWVPNPRIVGPGFTPYLTAGHWSYDERGNYVWVSDYPWGWAPFHYGRWVFVGTLGWAWIPGRTYAGAWVVWRAGVPGWGYVGWAPTPPTWIWRYGRSAPLALRPRPPYVYVPHRNLLDHDVHGFASRGPSAVRIERHTRELSRPPAPPRPPRMGPAGPHPRR